MMTKVRSLLGSPLTLVVLAGVAVVASLYPPWGQRYSLFNLATGRAPSREPDPTETRVVTNRRLTSTGVLKPPQGFSVTMFGAGLIGARFMRFAENGDLLVTQMRTGQVAVLRPDANGDGKSDETVVLLSHLDGPHGIDIHDGWLYIAEGGALFRQRLAYSSELPARLEGEREYLTKAIPRGGGHSTRSVRVAPSGELYVSIGSSCNVCVEKDPRRATIMRFKPDGTDGKVFASGLRNSVGMAFHPQTGKLYATDNGRDLLGDDFPPCELNLIEEGQFYGWPFANGDRTPDPDLGNGHEKEIAASRPPLHKFRAHNAPLGLTFVSGNAAPQRYKGALLVALHGSWNRSMKDGYKVVSLTLDGGATKEEDFLTGFTVGEETLGRPVDVAVGPDGAIYVSDDLNGQIYRVAPKKS